MGALRETNCVSLTSRRGGWLPFDTRELNAWCKSTLEEAEKSKDPFHPVIEEFRIMIESDPVLFMNFTLMFEQQPRFPPPPHSGDVKLKNYHQMLKVINHILRTAPTYNSTGMVGCPINAILEFPMITPAGLSAFTMEKVNLMFRKVLRVWAQFLDSPDSRHVLNDSPTGWLNPSARKALRLDEFQTKPDEPYLGFKSWNDFFIREFRPGMRPIANPDDDTVIVSACESTPYSIQIKVKEHDRFWLKRQPYSLRQMLNGHYVKEFVDGAVYQAFLSPANYHRWHSPINGAIKKLDLVAGAYFAEAGSEGFDPAGPTDSQGYLAHVATRALIFIEGDNPAIGLVCVIPIGMAEVSSCMLERADGSPLKEGQRVKKGEQIGYFQYGGSTYCLVFRAGVISEFALQAVPQGDNGSESGIVKVNSLLARSK
ncbi:MAG: phosphatidylserine decarboxylase family protein [Chloracidobacterium sp.]|nr:phosphatidylserine decarboxylase family protein [Chloracidobacterium sp.]